jgi:hypothetical protein
MIYAITLTVKVYAVGLCAVRGNKGPVSLFRLFQDATLARQLI